MIVCKKCGVEAKVVVGTCIVCGAPFQTVATPGTASLRVTGYAPTVVISGPDSETGDEVIKVAAPGAHSEMRLRRDGFIELSVEGAAGVGRSGERRVMEMFRQKLEQEGIAISFDPGRDQYGEDAKLCVGSNIYTFQIVTAPHAKDFWRNARVGSATAEIDIGRAAGWLGTAVSIKAGKMSTSQLAETVLAIDAQHAGFLTAQCVLDAYYDGFGEPSSTVGFASVWIVGPTPPYCARLGDGRP